MSTLSETQVLSRLSSGRVAVIGDLMLDVYLWGQASRISPEAPVPVVNVKRRSCCLGGASNVLRNLRTLGAGAYAFGVVGSDNTARELLDNLNAIGIDAGGVLIDSSRRTTEKRRIIANGQQLLRVDIEDAKPVSDALRRKMVDKLIASIRQGLLDAVIFEDYNKGLLASWMLEEIATEARKHKVITALDPKPGNLTPVRHLSVIKPNRAEAFAMAGLTDDGSDAAPEHNPALLRAAAVLLESWQPDLLLMSLAAQGMALFRPALPPEVIPTRAREVFDVSGAGDTVTATYTLAAVAGASARVAAELANRAAGVVVGRVGTAPISLEELQRELSAEDKAK